MTRKEFMKYNQEMYDKQGKRINPGDTVVINNNYESTPMIGVADHFTEGGNVAVLYDWYGWKGKVMKGWAYRRPSKIIKLKSGRRKKSEV